MGGKRNSRSNRRKYICGFRRDAVAEREQEAEARKQAVMLACIEAPPQEVAAAPPRRRNSAKDAEQMEVDNGQSATGGDGVLEVTMHESTKGSSKARKENTLMQKGGRKRGQRRVSIAAMGWPVKPVRRAKNDGVRKVKGSRLIKKQRKERKQQIQQVADLLGNMGMQ